MIKGFVCPNGQNMDINFDYPFDSACLKTCQHRCHSKQYLYGLMISLQKQTDPNLYRVSNLVSPCARKGVWSITKDSYRTPDEFSFALTGTAVHEWLQQYPFGIKERAIKKEVPRLIDGLTITVSGHPDVFDETDIWDYKTQAMVAWMKAPKQDHIEQLNIYEWIIGRKLKKHLIYIARDGEKEFDCPDIEDVETLIIERVKAIRKEEATPCWLCDKKNRFKKVYCPVSHLCDKFPFQELIP